MSDTSWIGVFLLWEMRYLDYYITNMRTYCKKDSYHRRWACFIDVEE